MDKFNEDMEDRKVMEFEEGDLEEVEVDDTPLENDEMIDDDDDDDEKEAMDDDEGGGLEEGEENEFTVNVIDQSDATFALHGDCVYVCAIHPTKPGVVMTGGGDDRGMLWSYEIADHSLENDNERNDRNIVQCNELAGHTDTVVAVGFNFDGTLALTGGYDGVVKIWKTDTGELLQSLEGPEDIEWADWHSKASTNIFFIRCHVICLCVQGNAVVAGSKDGTIWMWLAHNGQCVQVLAGHDGGVSCGLFTKDGKTIVSGGEDGTVRLWAPKTGQCKHVFSAMDGHESMITALAGNDDGDLVMSGGMDGQVRLFLVPKKKLLMKLTHSAPSKSSSSSEKANIPPPPPGSDNDKGDYDPSDDIEMDEEITVLGVECVGLSHGQWKFAASGGLDKTMKIWDITTGSCRCICEHEDSVVALKWHANLPVVVTACLDRVIRIWDARSGSCVKEMAGHRDIITNLDFRQQPVLSKKDKEEVTTFGDVIVSVSDDGTAKVFFVDLRTLVV